jgi:hypothetical protein
LWRETIAANSSLFFARTMAALAFATSRITVVVFAGTMVAEPSGAPYLFILLNFACLYLAARCLPVGIAETRPVVGGTDESAEPASHRGLPDAEWRTVKYQTAVFALTAGLVYVVVPQASSAGLSLLGFLGAAALGATVRVSGALFSASRHAIAEVRLVLFVLVASLVASWLLVVAAGTTFGETAALLIKAAQVSDIVALVSGLLSLQTNYIVVGTRMRREAEEKEIEIGKARAELSLLNRVASDMYEDSHSMIAASRITRARSFRPRTRNDPRNRRIQHKNVKELLQIG